MILVVMSHCDDIFGLTGLYSKTLGIPKLINDFLDIGGQVGVGCFLLISGYFLAERKFSLARILKLAGEVWFYIVGTFAVWAIVGTLRGDLSQEAIAAERVYVLFPILYSRLWFVTAYMILSVLSPFLNELIFRLDRRTYRAFLAVLILIFVVIDGGYPKFMPGISDGRILPVFVIYFIAGYIKRFRTERHHNAGRHFLSALVFYLLLFGSAYLLTYLGVKRGDAYAMEQRYFFRALNSPLVVTVCVETFLGTLEMEMPCRRVINTLASCTFGVYLFHANRIMRVLVLPKWFPISRVSGSAPLFFASMAGVAVIYLAATVIDLLRQYTVGRLWDRLVDRLAPPLERAAVRVICFAFGVIRKFLSVIYGTKREDPPAKDESDPDRT